MLRIMKARRAAAVICLEAVLVGHAGKDTVIVSDPWLAVQRDIDRGVAGSQRWLLADLGWLRLVAGGRPGFPARMRFTKLPAAVGATVTGASMYETVGQIAAQDERTDLVAAIFCSAAHPAWNYAAELDTLHWLVALADAAGVDPVSLGVTARRIPTARKQLIVLLGEPSARDAASLMEALDEHAIEVGAFQVYESAEEARRAAAEDRHQEVMATRKAKRAAAEERSQAKAQAKEAAKVLKAVPAPAGPVRETVEEQAINNVVQPMESRGIPWALTFGNHDEDSLPNRTNMPDAKILDFIRSYKFNANSKNDKLQGESNSQLLIASSKSSKPAFGIWLLDSNRYAPTTVGGQDFEGLMSYDWIRPEQIAWYREASKSTENRCGKVQSLMFFHIPLWEHHHMWYGSQFTSNDADHEKAVKKHSIVGLKNEGIYTGAFNSGMFTALQERGDVRGVYCGHDHINTFKGDYYGIELGYGPGTGFGTYGLGDAENHHLRGARVFELNENKDGVYTGTRTVFAKDLGIDMSTKAQPLDSPLPMP